MRLKRAIFNLCLILGIVNTPCFADSCRNHNSVIEKLSINPDSLKKTNINIDTTIFIVNDSITNGDYSLRIKTKLTTIKKMSFDPSDGKLKLKDSTIDGDGFCIFGFLPVSTASQTIQFVKSNTVLSTITNKTLYHILNKERNYKDSDDNCVVWEVTLLKGKEDLYLINDADDDWSGIDALYTMEGKLLWYYYECKAAPYEFGDYDKILLQYGIKENIPKLSKRPRILPCNGYLLPRIGK